jgi:hypothetical protein
MLVASHKTLGNIVCNIIEQNLNIKLDRDGILYGCELPDISPNLILIFHFKKFSFDFVLNLISSLMSQELPHTKTDLKNFSINLGIVLHYIADYFCYAHNRKKFNFLPLHIVYEYMLDYRISNFQFDNLIKDICSRTYNENYSSPNFIKNFINSKLSEYNCKEHVIDDDIIYSLEACLIITHAIITHAIIIKSLVPVC